MIYIEYYVGQTFDSKHWWNGEHICLKHGQFMFMLKSQNVIINLRNVLLTQNLFLSFNV